MPYATTRPKSSAEVAGSLAGAGLSLVCTELFGFVVTVSVVVALLLTGFPVILVLTAAALVSRAVNLAIGPVDWLSLRRERVLA